MDKACVDNYVEGYTEVVLVGISLDIILTIKLMIVCWILSCTYHYGGEYNRAIHFDWQSLDALWTAPEKMTAWKGGDHNTIGNNLKFTLTLSYRLWSRLATQKSLGHALSTVLRMVLFLRPFWFWFWFWFHRAQHYHSSVFWFCCSLYRGVRGGQRFLVLVSCCFLKIYIKENHHVLF